MPGLDPVLHQATRLRLMAVLQRNRDVAFVALRDALGTTDGNLNAHGAVLQRAGYVDVRRVLRRDGFAVHYRLTPVGASAFEAYAAQLLALLGKGPGPEATPSTADVATRMAAAEVDGASAAQRTAAPQHEGRPSGKP